MVNRRKFGPTLPGIAHAHTHLPANRFTPGEGRTVWSSPDLMRFVTLRRGGIAACFVEPIAI